MSGKAKRFFKSVIPPFIWEKSKLFRIYLKLKGWEEAGEKDAQWYDKALQCREILRAHYTGSPFFFLFSIMADRIIRSGISSVLDIGCGSAQIAPLLHDRGLEEYVGFDFSPKRIEHAKKSCPGFRFEVADAFNTDLYQSVTYSAVICSEFLEHVEKDTEILKKIPPGKLFFGAVPNYPLKNHVRYFNSSEEVYERYKPFFSKLTIDWLLRNPGGKVLYLLEGTIA